MTAVAVTLPLAGRMPQSCCNVGVDGRQLQKEVVLLRRNLVQPALQAIDSDLIERDSQQH